MIVTYGGNSMRPHSMHPLKKVIILYIILNIQKNIALINHSIDRVFMSNEIINKGAERIQNELINYGITTKFIEFSASTRTAQEAADAIGCNIAQIIKSLVFCTDKTNQPILILASGINRVNEKIIEQLIGKKIKKANADFVKMVTGFAIGGVPPLGHAQKITTFIDKDLLQYDQVWAAAGTPHTVFCLNSSNLVRITDGTITCIQ
jgi:prolyl-tRNA editing enzyme YbaK/EbsC (Cys-tRNA(Pro) deacylase)